MPQAAEPQLHLLLAAERVAALKWLARGRVVAVTLVTLWVTVLGLRGGEVWGAAPALAAGLLVAGALALFFELRPRALVHSGLAIALVDLPLTWFVTWKLSALGTPGLAVPLATTLSVFLVMCSALALDYLAIELATAVSLACCGRVAWLLETQALDMVDPVGALCITGVLAALIVSRLRALTVESRQKDFAGKYLLGERIGAGGMAEVYKATYSPAGGFERQVALKRVLLSMSTDQQSLAQFRHEAELGSQLAHPNLVQILDFGRHLDSWFLAMEYVEGLSVRHLLEAHAFRAPLPLQACLYVIAEVAEGLAYLHEKVSADGEHQGLVHRDLNPPNVLVSFHGEVKIIDFGIMRWTDVGFITEVGHVRGKLPYLAPESLTGAPPARAADLFALGVMSWELLTNRRLFRSPDDAEVERAILTAPIPSVAELRPEVPTVAVTLVAALLDRDPRHRPSARQVAAALRNLEGEVAPYPSGRAVLRAAVASVGVLGLPTAPGVDPQALAETVTQKREGP